MNKYNQWTWTTASGFEIEVESNNNIDCIITIYNPGGCMSSDPEFSQKATKVCKEIIVIFQTTIVPFLKKNKYKNLYCYPSSKSRGSLYKKYGFLFTGIRNEMKLKL